MVTLERIDDRSLAQADAHVDPRCVVADDQASDRRGGQAGLLRRLSTACRRRPAHPRRAVSPQHPEPLRRVDRGCSTCQLMSSLSAHDATNASGGTSCCRGSRRDAEGHQREGRCRSVALRIALVRSAQADHLLFTAAGRRPRPRRPGALGCPARNTYSRPAACPGRRRPSLTARRCTARRRWHRMTARQ